MSNSKPAFSVRKIRAADGSISYHVYQCHMVKFWYGFFPVRKKSWLSVGVWQTMKEAEAHVISMAETDAVLAEYKYNSSGQLITGDKT